MAITEQSSVPEIRRQAEHLRHLMEEPGEYQEYMDTQEAMCELRGVIHMKLTHISEKRKELSGSIQMARSGGMKPWLTVEDIPELERERQQWLNVQNELIDIMSTYL